MLIMSVKMGKRGLWVVLLIIEFVFVGYFYVSNWVEGD